MWLRRRTSNHVELRLFARAKPLGRRRTRVIAYSLVHPIARRTQMPCSPYAQMSAFRPRAFGIPADAPIYTAIAFQRVKELASTRAISATLLIWALAIRLRVRRLRTKAAYASLKELALCIDFVGLYRLALDYV